MKRSPLIILLLACFLNVAASKDNQKELSEFFERRIRPVLSASCYECHQGEVQDVEAGLQVDSREGLLRGGTRGPALVVGKPDESLLVLALDHADQLQMPPKSKLPQQQIADFRTWIQQGAYWPGQMPAGNVSAERRVVDTPRTRDDFPAEARSFWAFQPPHAPPLPQVHKTTWVRSWIDRFVLARLEAAGLQPAPEADARTWLRRVTYDLTGLPPTRSEIRQFLSDSSPDAYERIVDRLLSSPRYAEKWGRHWLDVARYADSNGLDENLAYANAFRYRDYVIDSFATDKPFDRFILEQLAGDLLPDNDTTPRNERWIATGFLSLGAKMLAEDDPMKMQMDIVDEQVDTIGRAFMGLTLGCARCHDHKFDPVTSADYYALAGILKSTTTMENFQVVAKWQERPISSTELIERHAQLTTQLSELAHDAPLRKELEQQLPELEFAMAVSDGSPEDLRIHIRGSHLTLGEQVHRRLPAIFRDTSDEISLSDPTIPAEHSGRLELAQWLVHPHHPLTSRVIANRLWQWHFGAGLVASPDNFGMLGQRPSHQGLLDALAIALQRNNWSLKSLHRELVLSATYRMSYVHDAAATDRDPENRLWWRTNQRRLDAEEIRDAILMAPGDLDLQMGGSLLPTENRKYVTSTANVNPAIYSSRRRSVYLPVVRSALYEVFQAFDFPDPSVLSGQRQSTTVAPQALFMMNSLIVAEQTRRLAESLVNNQGLNDEQRIDIVFETLLSRLPDDKEKAFLREYLAESRILAATFAKSPLSPSIRAWQSLCRAIMTTNEFIYVD